MDYDRRTCRCRYCGKVWDTLADEWDDHPCGCLRSVEAEIEDEETEEQEEETDARHRE